MSRDIWLQERAELQEVLGQMASGKLILEHGRDEYVAGLVSRIAELDELLAGAAADEDG